jgi:hypothetical protein
MPTYLYQGPRAGCIHPVTKERLVLMPGQSYDLPSDSLPGLMSKNRSADLGRLTLTEEPRPKAKADKPKSSSPTSSRSSISSKKKDEKPAEPDSSTAIAASASTN